MQQIAVQPGDRRTPLVRGQICAAYLLAWVAAFTDAIGYLTLQQLGASYMSGNSMSLGVALGRAESTAALKHGLPVLSFVLGLLLGALVLMQMRRRGARCGFAAVFALEGLCILLFQVVGSGALQHGVIASSPPSRFYTCMALLTLAMGLQTATVHRIGSQGLRTTFVTGLLSDLTDALLHYLAWLHEHAGQHRLRQALGASIKQPAFRKLLVLGGVWGCYVVGAICGSALEQQWSLRALLFPLGVLVLLIALDIVRPFDQ